MGQHRTLSNGVRAETPLTVRVAGLPGRVLTSLRFDRSFAMADEIIGWRERLAAEGPVLADALYEIIGDLPEGTPKPGLVGLRRALHRGRRPRPAEWNDRVAEVLPRWLANRIGRWVAALATCDRRRADLPGVLAEEAAVKRVDLRDAARHAGFRRALSQASPTLFAELSRWLADAARAPRRQSLVRLAKYVARAAAKTSPYSTFTVSGAGVWTDDGPSVRSVAPNWVRGVVELDGRLLQGLVQALCEDPTLSRSLRLRLNPSATMSDGRVTFTGRPPAEPIVMLPATPAIRECLRILGDDPVLTRQGLRDSLAAAGGASTDSVEPFLAGLVDVGLVERLSPVTDLSDDPLGELTDWLATCGDHEIAEVVSLVGRVRAETRRDVPVDDVDGHDARRRELVRVVGELTTRVGGLPEVDDRTEKQIFHENAVFTGPAVECAFPCWRPALADLDLLRRWLAPFDPASPLRLALGSYFRERFGAGAAVPFLALHRAVQEELHRCGAPDQKPAASEVARLLHTRSDLAWPLTDSPLPRLRELARIRAQARDAALDAGTVDGVVRVPPAALAAPAAAWPCWVVPPASIGCYVQVTGDEEAPSLVLNAAHHGYGRGRSRLLHLLGLAGGATATGQATGPATATGQATGPPRRAPGGGPVFAELGGLFAASLNGRTASVPYELDYPATRSSRPRAQRIRPGDCVAVHDPETDLVRLRADELGTEVVPLHLGMMADILLPPAARLLTQAFGRGYLVYPGMPLLAADDELGVPETVTALPRVEAGKIVLRRACWVAPLAQVPSRAHGDTDADYWLRLLGWVRASGIPTRCFVRMWVDGLRPDRGTSAYRELIWMQDKSHKPVYVDFANWYLVLVFQRMLAGAGSVAVFEEALPAPEEPGHSGEDAAATELLVELSEPEES